MDNKRRSFLVNLIQAGAAATAAGTIVAGFAEENKAKELTLRPPGALKEDEFLKTCIRCGLCVEACKNRDNKVVIDGNEIITLKLGAPGDKVPIGTPYFIARTGPCFMCDDIPCMYACPTGALTPDECKNDKGEVAIDYAKMGVAVIDPSSCIAFWGLQCTACYRACPELDKAITIEWKQNKRTGKHAYRIPVVHEEACTGCGMCEQACVTEIAAIKIFPREVVLGKAGDRYVKGWDVKDQQRVKNASTDTKTVTGRSKKSAVDNLNEGIKWDQ
ncbi:periplasmic nitrate reductase, NapG subunit [Nautilia profundicola AmH]|uniref:Periplasmic nitrate reductase, NapG subunit n=1 Tax=Nautilia profundicola (strain ATCC BAA-1463 / DSM 18972 / AmH) TaxID=598659 RepID=B9L8L3_NAUPA|nr:ferredoxin-type protein NapG [Nautilia profundicola]ACM92842.1 periplasmic nitrate reductase, NapG subunit [Nautilia profundicola AmH]